MKQLFKTIFFQFCLCLSRVAEFFGHKVGPIVLMYHSVGENDAKLTVSPHAFRGQMEYIRDHRSVVSMEDILCFLDGKKSLPKNAVAVTIDDGYLDTYREAFPILKEFKIPFTLFLTTNLSEMKPLANLSRPTWDQLREMSAVGLMTVGLHGHNHLHVNEIAGDRALLDRELKDSALLIEKEIGKAPRVYAYAFGARDPRIPPYLKEIGVEAGFGITDGILTPSHDHYALPRVQIDRTMTFRLFALRTTGAVEIAQKLKKLLR
jgi:peptidoglycan/xylan/chitin deacetylase (PgdA/CDA1 family)